MGPHPEPQNYDPATPLSWTPDGRQYDDTEEEMGELDKKVEAATKAKDAILLWRGLGFTDEQIIDAMAKIMAETLPEKA